MVRLPVIAAALILPGLALAQPADDAAKCQAAAGSYLTGTVVSGPRLKHGAPLHGTYVSHTHLTLRGDADGRAYDVAIDNVFANGYRHNPRIAPVAPIGWPWATAPPSTLTMSSGTPSSRATAIGTAAKASLISMR